MLLAELFFKLRHRGYPSACDVGEAALDARDAFQFIQVVENLLVGSGILNYNFGLSVDGQNDGMTCIAHLLEEVAGVSLEITERMDVFADVEHHASPC
jgi:hypothetical protein